MITTRKPHRAITALTAAVLIADIAFPSNWSLSQVYIVSVLLTSRVNHDRLPFVLATITSLFTALAPTISFRRIESPLATLLITRGINILLLWCAAIFAASKLRLQRQLTDISNDIEEHQRIETALRDSEQRFSAFMRYLPGFAWIKDSQGRYVFVNDSFVRTFLPPPLPTSNFTDYEIFPEQAAAQFRDNDRRAVASPTAISFMEFLTNPDGALHTYITNKFPISGSDGLPPLYGGIAIDITDQHEAEKALRLERDRFNTLAATAPGIICSLRRRTDGTFCFPYISPLIAKLYGFTVEEMARDASPAFSLVLPEHVEHVRQTLAESARTMKPWREVFQVSHPEFGSIWVETHGRPTLDSDGSILWHGFVTDVTEHKKADEELLSSRQRLEVLSRHLIATQETERRHLSRELHDEIGQVLTAIKMNLRRTQRHADASLQSFFDENITIVDQAVGVVRNLSLSLRPSQLDELGLVAALHWFVKFQSRIGGFQDELVVDIGDADIPSELSTVCFRIVQEAMTNSIRHARSNSVRVNLQVCDDELYLRVEDDGVGFDVVAARRRASEGKSLGLLSMQERVNLAKGRMNIESTIGRGTRIESWFPLK